jgi:DNA-directed RNA polymerase subunit RPC12/RpoP
LRRVHRTFLERFRYRALYECQNCETEQYVPRSYEYHFGPEARCPRCGTTRLSRLKRRDGIDKMRGGLVNLWNRIRGGKLLHCPFCRLQFHDRRPLGTKTLERAEEARDTAKSVAVGGREGLRNES